MPRRSVVLPMLVALAVLAIPSVTLLATHHGHNRSPFAATPADSGTAGPDCPVVKKLPDGKRIAVDWADFIHAFGRTYISGRYSRLAPTEPTTRADLGPVVLTIRCEIGKLTFDTTFEVNEGFRDGDAAFLSAGTPVYAVNGYKPDTRLAVIVDGKVVVYLPDRPHEGGPVPGGSR
jgi:hypothetical protein